MSGFTISRIHADEMSARMFVVLSHAILTNCVTVNLHSLPEIISKTKVELTPILITSGLNDIVVLSAPILDGQAIYYLHRPNGDALRLKFKDNTTERFSTNHVIHKNQFKIFNVNRNKSCCDVTDVQTRAASHDFVIGPLQDSDHGNWVLSAYIKDIDGHWMEIFQVITVEIIETVPLTPEKSQLTRGDTFILSFAYQLPDLESCQIEPPPSTVDRFYDRTKTGVNKCEFIMKNVTYLDEGTWTIIGVGRIVYKGAAFLQVRDLTDFYNK